MLPIQGAWVQSLVGELASHIAYDTANNIIKNKKQTNKKPSESWKVFGRKGSQDPIDENS